MTYRVILLPQVLYYQLSTSTDSFVCWTKDRAKAFSFRNELAALAKAKDLQAQVLISFD
jgi:hypothetical protein